MISLESGIWDLQRLGEDSVEDDTADIEERREQNVQHSNIQKRKYGKTSYAVHCYYEWEWDLQEGSDL
jgi:hypothetical protein